ncbi:MAG: hypothetical protein QOH36_1721 [Actinomycetota bacterium]|nr:hypothetical protein [Actinomycetota bacterium]
MVDQFLEQIEGGAFDEESVSRRHGQNATNEVGETSSEERGLTLRQTSSSRFDRLYRLLLEDGAIKELDGIDDEVWSEIRSNEFIQVSGMLIVPDIIKQIAAMQGISQMLPLIEMANDLVDPEQRIPTMELEGVKQKMPVLSGVAEQVANRPVPCIIAVAGAPRFKFLTQLSRAHLIGTVDDLEGEATVLGRVQRKLARGQSEDAEGELIGLPRQARLERRRGPQKPTTRLTYPGAVLAPLSIWR